MKQQSFAFAISFLLSFIVAVGIFVPGCEGVVTYELRQTPITNDRPVYITFYHSTFNDSTLVYLSGNASKCDTGTTYTDPWPTSTPADVLGNVVQWTRHDPTSFLRVPFVINSGNRPSAAEIVHVCYSLNKGLTWHEALDSLGQTSFKLWPAMPTARLEPTTPVVGEPFSIVTSQVPFHSRGVIVRAPRKCRGPHPEDSFFTNASLSSGSLTFTTTTWNGGDVWFCVAQAPYTHWSILPVDPQGLLTFPATGGPTHEMPVGGLGFTIYERTIVLKSVSCSTIIAGAQVRCVLEMNATSPVVLADELTFASIRDGAGVEECPQPVIRPWETATQFTFDWVPQRHGRDGRFMLLYLGKPLFVRPDLDRVGQPAYNFTVLPEFSFIDQFDYANHLITLDYFQPHTDVTFSDGVPNPFGGRQNGSTAGEMRVVTLKPDVSSATITQTVMIPGGAGHCRVGAHYYFSAETVDQFATVHIGTFTVEAQDAASAPLQTMTYELYSSTRRVIVVGAHKADIVDGDVRMMEQLVRHFQIRSDFEYIKVSLSMERTSASLLYWAKPELKCVTVRPFTNPRDVEGLKELYADVGANSADSLVTNWEVTKGSGLWNTDPCRTHWQGVTCRHFRVVGVNLANRNLKGVFPRIARLDRLEMLNLGNNELQGAIPRHLSNSTRLKELDVSKNNFEAFESTLVFTGSKHHCLSRLWLQHNEFRQFPRQFLTLPKLQVLDLSYNHMSDNVPNLAEENQVLEQLNLRSNQLTGILPTLKASSIRMADFADNRFNGTIPSQWGDLQQAQSLDVSNNNLKGAIPLELSKIRTAGKLVFRSAGNHHTGFLPNLPLQTVDLRGNVFRCPLPFNYSWIVGPIVGLESHLKCDHYDPDAASEY